MQIVSPIDIEDQLRIDLTALYAALGLAGVTFTAPPLPTSLGDVPQSSILVCFTRVGGSRDSLVIDTHAVSADLYASTWGQAMRAANRLAGVLASLPYQNITKVQYDRCEITNPPVVLPDTSNPVSPRVRIQVSVGIKADISVLPSNQ